MAAPDREQRPPWHAAADPAPTCTTAPPRFWINLTASGSDRPGGRGAVMTATLQPQAARASPIASSGGTRRSATGDPVAV
jgi:hypothetical protein